MNILKDLDFNLQRYILEIAGFKFRRINELYRPVIIPSLRLNLLYIIGEGFVQILNSLNENDYIVKSILNDHFYIYLIVNNEAKDLCGSGIFIQA